MKGHLTVGFEVRPDQLERALAALREAGIEAHVQQLAGREQPILLAGFAHDGPAPNATQRGAAREQALQVLTAAGVQAVPNGGGFTHVRE